MKMNLLSRIVISTLLPKEGSFTDLIIAKDIAKKTDITQEEVKQYGIVADGTKVTWNDEGIKAEFDFEFTEAEKGMLSKQLKTLDEEKKLTTEHLELYELFTK